MILMRLFWLLVTVAILWLWYRSIAEEEDEEL